MSTREDLERKFWKALESDRTIMLGLDGAEDGHTRPMTAQIENERSPIWFFTTKDNELALKLEGAHCAIATFVSQGHDIFAALHGTLSLDNAPAAIERLWNSHVAAWYPGGRKDPNIALLRLDADRAEIWQKQSNSVFDGIKLMMGAHPQKKAAGDAAEVALR